MQGEGMVTPASPRVTRCLDSAMVSERTTRLPGRFRQCARVSVMRGTPIDAQNGQSTQFSLGPESKIHRALWQSRARDGRAACNRSGYAISAVTAENSLVSYQAALDAPLHRNLPEITYRMQAIVPRAVTLLNPADVRLRLGAAFDRIGIWDIPSAFAFGAAVVAIHCPSNEHLRCSGSRPPVLLKGVAQAQLDHTRRKSILKFSKLGAIVDVQNRIVEVHVVEGIERLAPELQPMAFPRKSEGLHHGDVDIHQSGNRTIAGFPLYRPVAGSNYPTDDVLANRLGTPLSSMYEP